MRENEPWKGLVRTMTIEDMFGDLKKIDILAEKSETNEVLMVLVCNGFIDGSP